jgi:hypothetical protein
MLLNYRQYFAAVPNQLLDQNLLIVWLQRYKCYDVV